MIFDFSKSMTKKVRKELANELLQLSQKIGFKVSARGWCYLMEQEGLIDKSQFDRVSDAINQCRKEGSLPIDFVASEDARMFKGVEYPSDGDTLDTLKWMLQNVTDGAKYFTPDWWAYEKYYIQVVVEKIDLVTLFAPVCAEYHIPIANAKGWSSILQRGEYAKRFKQAEDMGLQCVLLYCGDHDADGLRISETLMKNLEDVQDVVWHDGTGGYNPRNLIIDRFGLNYDYILRNRLTWIDNLITGSGSDLASPKHPNFKLDYVQDYIGKVGVRKCEANAIVTTPVEARRLMRSTIEGYLGADVLQRFKTKRRAIDMEYADNLEKTGLAPIIQKVLDGKDFN